MMNGYIRRDKENIEKMRLLVGLKGENAKKPPPKMAPILRQGLIFTDM